MCAPRGSTAGSGRADDQIAGPADEKVNGEVNGKVEEVVQELFLGQVAFPQDALELQITAMLGGSRAAGQTFAAAGLEVELGLTDRLQLSAEVPLEWASASASGARGTDVGNAALGALYNPLNDRARGVALSAGLELTLPTASRDGAAAWGVEAFAVAYRALGRVHGNLKLGVELERPTGSGAEREISPAGALGVLVPIGRWVPVLELRGDLRGDPAAVLAAGTLWHPAGGLELGAAAQLGLDTGSIGGLVIATVELPLAGE